MEYFIYSFSLIVIISVVVMLVPDFVDGIFHQNTPKYIKYAATLVIYLIFLSVGAAMLGVL